MDFIAERWTSREFDVGGLEGEDEDELRAFVAESSSAETRKKDVRMFEVEAMGVQQQGNVRDSEGILQNIFIQGAKDEGLVHALRFRPFKIENSTLIVQNPCNLVY